MAGPDFSLLKQVPDFVQNPAYDPSKMGGMPGLQQLTGPGSGGISGGGSGGGGSGGGGGGGASGGIQQGLGMVQKLGGMLGGMGGGGGGAGAAGAGAAAGGAEAGGMAGGAGAAAGAAGGMGGGMGGMMAALPMLGLAHGGQAYGHQPRQMGEVSAKMGLLLPNSGCRGSHCRNGSCPMCQGSQMPGRAAGGPSSVGQPYQVGEQAGAGGPFGQMGQIAGFNGGVDPSGGQGMGMGGMEMPKFAIGGHVGQGGGGIMGDQKGGPFSQVGGGQAGNPAAGGGIIGSGSMSGGGGAMGGGGMGGLGASGGSSLGGDLPSFGGGSGAFSNFQPPKFAIGGPIGAGQAGQTGDSMAGQYSPPSDFGSNGGAGGGGGNSMMGGGMGGGGGDMQSQAASMMSPQGMAGMEAADDAHCPEGDGAGLGMAMGGAATGGSVQGQQPMNMGETTTSVGKPPPQTPGPQVSIPKIQSPLAQQSQGGGGGGDEGYVGQPGSFDNLSPSMAGNKLNYPNYAVQVAGKACGGPINHQNPYQMGELPGRGIGGMTPGMNPFQMGETAGGGGQSGGSGMMAPPGGGGSGFRTLSPAGSGSGNMMGGIIGAMGHKAQGGPTQSMNPYQMGESAGGMGGASEKALSPMGPMGASMAPGGHPPDPFMGALQGRAMGGPTPGSSPYQMGEPTGGMNMMGLGMGGPGLGGGKGPMAPSQGHMMPPPPQSQGLSGRAAGGPMGQQTPYMTGEQQGPMGGDPYQMGKGHQGGKASSGKSGKGQLQTPPRKELDQAINKAPLDMYSKMQQQMPQAAPLIAKQAMEVRQRLAGKRDLSSASDQELTKYASKQLGLANMLHAIPPDSPDRQHLYIKILPVIRKQFDPGAPGHYDPAYITANIALATPLQGLLPGLLPQDQRGPGPQGQQMGGQQQGMQDPNQQMMQQGQGQGMPPQQQQMSQMDPMQQQAMQQGIQPREMGGDMDDMGSYLGGDGGSMGGDMGGAASPPTPTGDSSSMGGGSSGGIGGGEGSRPEIVVPEKGSPYMVGQNGPEVHTPSQDSFVIPNPKTIAEDPTAASNASVGFQKLADKIGGDGAAQQPTQPSSPGSPVLSSGSGQSIGASPNSAFGKPPGSSGGASQSPGSSGASAGQSPGSMPGQMQHLGNTGGGIGSQGSGGMGGLSSSNLGGMGSGGMPNLSASNFSGMSGGSSPSIQSGSGMSGFGNSTPNLGMGNMSALHSGANSGTLGGLSNFTMNQANSPTNPMSGTQSQDSRNYSFPNNSMSSPGASNPQGGLDSMPNYSGQMDKGFNSQDAMGNVGAQGAMGMPRMGQGVGQQSSMGPPGSQPGSMPSSLGGQSPSSVQNLMTDPSKGLLGGSSSSMQPSGQQMASSATGNPNANPMGMSSNYLSKVNQAEGTGNNPSSSASGKYQFTNPTYGEYLKHSDPSQYSQYKGMDQAGQSQMKDQGMAKDPNAPMSWLTNQNASSLGKAGIEANDNNLYASHFLGPGNATKVLGQPENSPVSNYLSPGVINANQSVLGGGKTVGQFKDWLDNKMGGGFGAAGAHANFQPQGGQQGQSQNITLPSGASNNVSQQGMQMAQSATGNKNAVPIGMNMHNPDPKLDQYSQAASIGQAPSGPLGTNYTDWRQNQDLRRSSMDNQIEAQSQRRSDMLTPDVSTSSGGAPMGDLTGQTIRDPMHEQSLQADQQRLSQNEQIRNSPGYYSSDYHGQQPNNQSSVTPENPSVTNMRNLQSSQAQLQNFKAQEQQAKSMIENYSRVVNSQTAGWDSGYARQKIADFSGKVYSDLYNQQAFNDPAGMNRTGPQSYSNNQLFAGGNGGYNSQGGDPAMNYARSVTPNGGSGVSGSHSNGQELFKNIQAYEQAQQQGQGGGMPGYMPAKMGNEVPQQYGPGGHMPPPGPAAHANPYMGVDSPSYQGDTGPVNTQIGGGGLPGGFKDHDQIMNQVRQQGVPGVGNMEQQLRPQDQHDQQQYLDQHKPPQPMADEQRQGLSSMMNNPNVTPDIKAKIGQVLSNDDQMKQYAQQYQQQQQPQPYQFDRGNAIRDMQRGKEPMMANQTSQYMPQGQPQPQQGGVGNDQGLKKQDQLQMGKVPDGAYFDPQKKQFVQPGTVDGQGRPVNNQQEQPKAPPGYQWSNSKPGSLEAIPGGPGAKVSSDAAGRFAQYKVASDSFGKAQSMILNSDGSINRSVINTAAVGQRGVPFTQGREFKSVVYRSVDAALRAATGSAMSPGEWPKYEVMYSPSPGDTDNQIKEKMQSLNNFVTSAKGAIDPSGAVGRGVDQQMQGQQGSSPSQGLLGGGSQSKQSGSNQPQYSREQIEAEMRRRGLK